MPGWTDLEPVTIGIQPRAEIEARFVEDAMKENPLHGDRYEWNQERLQWGGLRTGSFIVARCSSGHPKGTHP